MTLNDLSVFIEKIVREDGENNIRPSYALRPDMVGIRFFDAPIIGCTSADDPIFARMKADPVAYGELLRLPREWMSGARSVISVFFPYTDEIKASSRGEGELPPAEWLHARIEGQAFLAKCIKALAGEIENAGYNTLIPALSGDFFSNRDDERMDNGGPLYVSCWSERHAAFAAGLGTFGLAKNLITEKGCCGRFGSIITDAPLDYTPRKYTQPYEYCNFCGACAERCPISSINAEEKNTRICAEFVQKTGKLFAPRYGCGRCQIDVPCERGIPGR